MSQIVFPAEELLNYSLQELRDVLTGEFALEFTDGILETNERDTKITLPMWDWFRERPIPLKMHHHLSHYTKTKLYDRNLHMRILNVMHWDIYRHYKRFGRFGDRDLLEELVERMYYFGNQQYNEMVSTLSKSVTSISIRDVIALFDVPEIKAILDNLRPTEISVIHATRDITDLITKSKIPAIKNNRAVRMARSGIIKTAQLVQAVAPTGYIEDIDGSIFPIPLMSNYTDGHRSLYENMAESRKASQAIQATKKELEDAVYQSRRQELLNEVIMNIHPGDCGTKSYIPFRLREENDLTESDLVLWQGLNYYFPDDPDKELHELLPTDTHLIGKILHFRILTECAHPDPNGVCETCVGAMSLTTPNRTNLGQFMTTDLYAFLIQLQLSKKHHLANSVVQHLRVVDDDARFLRVGKDGISYYFTEAMRGLKFKVIVGRREGKTMTDIMYLTDIDRVSISRITEITSMALEIDYGQYVDRRPFLLGSDKRQASFSHAMLKYIKEKYWELDEKNNFIVDMSDWDVDQPFAFVPMKNDSLADFSNQFKTHIEGANPKERIRDTLTDPGEFLIETYELLNSKLKINIAQVAVAVYGIMIVSAADKNFATPKPWSSKRGIGVMHRVMSMRSVTCALAFEHHSALFNSLESFTRTNRQAHPMDAIFFPEDLPIS